MQIMPELLPVVQITLPLLAGMWVASHAQNKRLDDIIARIGRIENELKSLGEGLVRVETVLKNHGERLTHLEDRLPPLVRTR